MSIIDSNVVDGIAVTEDGKGVALLLADHLSWENEYDHLMLLQTKINNYIAFYEEGQYKAKYPTKKINKAIIDIHFMYPPTENAVKFIKVVQEQVRSLGITIEYIVS